jgi:hypothetical protein
MNVPTSRSNLSSSNLLTTHPNKHPYTMASIYPWSTDKISRFTVQIPALLPSGSIKDYSERRLEGSRYT